MKLLREGFTTGTCASAAAKAAAALLTGRSLPDEVDISLPGGKRISMPVENYSLEGNAAKAVVKKFAGDDPDITDGVNIVASVSWSGGEGIAFDAGEGVGTVTKKGLQIPPGEPAINPVPREMIKKAVSEITVKPLRVKLSIPGGEELAKKTFNPRLGIKGGLSLLGTSGIVRPYSHPAIQESLKCALDVAVAGGVNTPIFTAGNIGTRSALKQLNVSSEQVIEVSNEWGFMLDAASQKSINALLAMGHPGKLAKLIAGDFDTHSSRSQSALPVVSSVAAEVLGLQSSDSVTVEGIFTELEQSDRETLANELADRIGEAVYKRVNKKFEIAVALVDMQGEVIGHSGNLGLWNK
ncbi:MAG: cobalt-precorrin-5B (C(1))-methyltransferase CbiD [Nitrospinota bacterium]